jgi:hypothetical protein
MPPASVKPFAPDKQRRARPRVDAWIPIAVLAAVVAIALFRPALEPGPFIARVTFVNSTEYAFDVDVAGAKADGWMLLGTAADQASTAVADVFDQGGTWTFRFTTQGRVAGEIKLRKPDLERSDWKVVIPPRYADALRAEGIVPTTPIH